MHRLTLIGGLLALGCAACEETPPSRRCDAETPCPAPQICNESGRCVDPPKNRRADGEPCSGGAECLGEACVDLGAGLVCATRCEDSADCGAGRSCALQAGQEAKASSPSLLALCGTPAPGTGFVGEACSDDDGCAGGLCHEGRCTQLCGECPPRSACAASTLEREGRSTQHGVCRLEPPLRLDELGALDTPAALTAPPIPFTVGEGTAFVVVAEGDVDKVVAIRRLEGPDGTLLVDMDQPKASLTRSGLYHGAGAVPVPGTDDPAGAAQAGTYKVWPQTYEPRYDKLVPVDGKITRVAVISRRFGDQGGLLDLNMHFSPGTGITAATAPNDGAVKDSIAELDRLYRAHLGLAVGEVSYFDLLAEHDTVPGGDAVRLLRSTYSQPGPRGNAVNVFWVQSLPPAKGLAGGIPGVPGLVGGPSSGILIEKAASGTRMGRLLAHEVGHFLGLWHTTEVSASEIASQDALVDTPVCPNNTAVEQCPDYQNVMFPYYLNAPDPLSFSAGQALIVRRSPWLYQDAYPEVCGPGIAGVDVTRSGFASGSTAERSSQLSGACGGAAGEVVHLQRMPFAAQALEIVVAGVGFDPVVHVRKDRCADGAAEVACAAAPGDGTPARVALEAPAAGDYFIIVDGQAGGGRYDLSVTITK